ncbi:MAG: DUF362 domain-containing protein [Candidatus Bathyarchaeia archaeon]
MVESKDVYILKIESLDRLEESIKEVMELTGFKAKGTIVIKPNICMPKYRAGAVTRPELIASVVAYIRDTADDVIVGESDGYNYSCNKAFRETGIEKAVKNAGGRILNFSDDKLVRVHLRNSKVKWLILPKTLLKADALIDMPVMKTHEFTQYSGAIKNLFGLIPYDRRIILHPYLNDVLLSLLTYFKPALTIMDAITAMEGNGPTKGHPVKLNLILASKCALALDITATRIMGMSWRLIDHLRYIAEKLKLDENRIKVFGYDVKGSQYRFAPPQMDFAVKMQHIVFKHELWTKILFYNKDFVKLCQKILNQYRRLRSSTRELLYKPQ